MLPLPSPSHSSYRKSLTAKQVSDLAFVLKLNLSHIAWASSYAQRLVKADLEEMRNDINFILEEIDRGRK